MRWKALSQITSQLISLIVQSLSKDFLKLKSNIWLICESKNRHSHILKYRFLLNVRVSTKNLFKWNIKTMLIQTWMQRNVFFAKLAFIVRKDPRWGIFTFSIEESLFELQTPLLVQIEISTLSLYSEHLTFAIH